MPFGSLSSYSSRARCLANPQAVSPPRHSRLLPGSYAERSGDALAIPGAVRIDPRKLEQYNDVEISPSRDVAFIVGLRVSLPAHALRWRHRE